MNREFGPIAKDIKYRIKSDPKRVSYLNTIKHIVKYSTQDKWLPPEEWKEPLTREELSMISQA
jgi:hypothetical protein